MNSSKVQNHVSKIKDIFKERLNSAESKLDGIMEKTRGDESEITPEMLVHDIFSWHFGSVVKNQTLAESYNDIYTTLEKSDWTQVAPDEFTLSEYLKFKKDKYRDLAMIRDRRTTCQAKNLVNSYKREAYKEVYHTLKEITYKQ